MSGVPVYTERGRAGGVRLSAGYATQLTALSPLEAEAIALVSTPVAVAGSGLSGPLASALEKIGAAVPAVHRLRARHARARLLFDTTPWFRREQPPEVLDRLRAAVWADVVCRLDYERSDGRAERYRIEPYALVAKVDTWYVVAATARGMRVFRLGRIRRFEATTQAFVRDPEFDLQRFWAAWCLRFEADTGHRYEVTTVISAAGRRRLAERYGGWHAAALASADGDPDDVRLRLDFEREEIAVEALLALGADARVVSPASLRRHLVARAREVVRTHQEVSPARRRSGARPRRR
jgi:predicted DNA-binding transcriptional regulator YafY